MRLPKLAEGFPRQVSASPNRLYKNPSKGPAGYGKARTKTTTAAKSIHLATIRPSTPAFAEGFVMFFSLNQSHFRKVEAIE